MLRCTSNHILKCTTTYSRHHHHRTVRPDINVLANSLKDIVCYRLLSTPFNLVSFATQRTLHTQQSPLTYATNMAPKKVCIIGSGNWGTAIAKITGKNVIERTNLFERTINMYMYEELYEGQKLSEIFNTTHINIKYLPGIKIPENVVAIPDVIKATENADILIFVLPHQFVQGICSTIKGTVKPGAVAISLIKGFDMFEGSIRLLSDVIASNLGIECAVLMGANLAHEVANELFCESTIGCKKKEVGLLMKNLFDTTYFRCSVVEDAATVEACGALKNVVAVGAGIGDGHKMGDNTKAAIVRLGMLEIIEFINFFFKESNLRTYFESCGLADLVTTCQGGRNRKLGEALVYSNKTLLELEEEILKGQSFQGPLVAKAVFEILKSKKMVEKFPIFVAVHLTCQRKMKTTDFINSLVNHPEHKTR
ncbi:glycerol-3-phosphate dehydrogenase NAD+, cytoplasmic-like [Octopus vulgaris]|uniref:Glycerol-3-phosphate dehydrogenase NAD+, cytoplasmic-like n=2 Tax=Octopus TaxID=6643 RepID=A0AA36FF13_OCTVU|nr:glycerol-3-phosphate dehydrogenase [NAD(+)], cytoplasmic [Octopus sinensis]CAI9735202.1 glycerol-3-phosphate dehydrogenase NAD+, cytoplasmic-like [Octopus vulgaris]